MSENNNKPQDPNPRFACEGCSVLLDVNDGDRLVFARLSGGACVFSHPQILIYPD